ncbi:NADH-quinone oxidoreductase subunit NuoE, partial [Streptomyces sp. SID4931]
SLVGLKLAKGEALPKARVVSPRAGQPADARPQDGQPHDPQVHDPSPAERLSSHDAPQQTSASDPEHPAGPAAEEGE